MNTYTYTYSIPRTHTCIHTHSPIHTCTSIHISHVLLTHTYAHTLVHVCDLCCSGRECCTNGLLKSVPGYGTYCFSFVCVWVCVLEVGRGECVCTRAYKVALVSKRAPPTPTLIHTGKVARARSVSQLNYQYVGSFTTTG